MAVVGEKIIVWQCLGQIRGGRGGLPRVCLCRADGCARIDHGGRGQVRGAGFAGPVGPGVAVRTGRALLTTGGLGTGRPDSPGSRGSLASFALGGAVRADQSGVFSDAAQLGPTSHVGIFYAVCPLVVLILAWAMRLERPNLGRLWGVLASVAGIVVIGVGNFWSGGAGTAAEVRSVVLADCLLIGAVSSWGAYLAVSKPLIERHGALPALAGTFLLGCLLSIPVALFRAGLATV